MSARHTADDDGITENQAEVVRQVNEHTDQAVLALVDYPGLAERVAALEAEVVALAAADDAIQADVLMRDVATNARIDETVRRLDDLAAVLQGTVDGIAILSARMLAVETRQDTADVTNQEQDATLGDHETRIAALEQKSDEPWSLVADVPCTADRADGWSSPYNKYRDDSQGPRWEGHVLPVEGGFQVVTQPVPVDVELPGGTVKAGEWASGGIALASVDLNPGMAWEVESRALGPTNQTRYAVLTWPVAGGWPQNGEIDYWEAGGDKAYRDRKAYKISNWYRRDDWRKEDGDDGRAHDERKIELDCTEWHTYRVEWTDQLVYYVDGVEVWRVREHVPTVTHHMTFQTALEGGPLAREGTLPGGIEIRAVRVYELT